MTVLLDLHTALTFLTVLPLGYQENPRPGRAFAYFPLVGLLIGAVLAGVAALEGIDPARRAFVVLVLWVLSTGGLHLDGFGDGCDGLLATTTPQRRLEIMKDPRAGSWAVVGLVLLLLGKWIAVRDVAPLTLLLAPALGRWSIVLAAFFFPDARAGGLATHFRAGFGPWQVGAATIVVLMAAAMLQHLALLLVPLLIVAVIGRWAARRLGGGITGDVYGFLCELTEVTCLLLV